MEFELIDFIRDNPILYDKKYRSLHHRDRKIQKWNEIARRLRRDPNTIRLKWKSLRDTYKRRLQRKVDDEDVLGTKHWKYHNHLMFLKDQYTEIEIDPVPVSKTENTTIEIEQDLSHLDEEQNLSNEPDFEVENFDLNEYLKKFDVTNNAANSATENDDQTKKRRLDKDSIITEASQEMATLLENAKQHFTPPSSTQIFFNSMALQVEGANLPPIDLMRLQQRVLEVVTQEIVMCQEGTTVCQDGATYIIEV